MTSLRDIPSLYNIADMVPGLRGSVRSRYAICPLPQHKHGRRPTPSFSVFWRDGKQYFKCHGNCQLKGNVIDFIGYMQIPGYDRTDKRHYREAAELLTRGAYQVSPPTPPPPTPTLPNWLWQDMLPPAQATIEYALSRGITEEQIVRFRIGTPPMNMAREPYNIYNPKMWMAIPTFHGETLMGIKLRNITKTGIRFMSVLGSTKGLFNYNAINGTTQPVLILNGEIASIVADRFGFLAGALTGGEASKLDQVRNALILARNIVVGDNDPDPAVRLKMQYYAAEKAAALNALLKFPPESYKDWDKWALGDTDGAVTITKMWMEEA